MNRYTLNAGYFCEIELIPELYANTALKQAITDEMKMVFGHDTRISIVLARPNMLTRISGQWDHQARALVLSVFRQFTNIGRDWSRPQRSSRSPPRTLPHGRAMVLQE